MQTRAHDLPQLGLDEREEDDGTASARPRCGEMDVLDDGDARVPDDLELLAGKLRLDRLDHPGRGLPRRVRDHVQLDEVGHRD